MIEVKREWVAYEKLATGTGRGRERRETQRQLLSESRRRRRGRERQNLLLSLSLQRRQGLQAKVKTDKRATYSNRHARHERETGREKQEKKQEEKGRERNTGRNTGRKRGMMRKRNSMVEAAVAAHSLLTLSFTPGSKQTYQALFYYMIYY